MSKEFSINHVCICAATYLRPKGLTRLLDSINKLNTSGLPESVRISVVIVDNDPDKSSESVIKECQKKGFRFSLEYLLETARGIPQARNRLLRAAKDLNCDVVAMIDDDETVDENWLISGLKAMDQWNADVIFGHLIPVFETTPPKWIVEGGFFAFPIYKDGSNMSTAYTYNVFFKTIILDSVPGFDNSTSLTGGEDSIFFSQVYVAGFSIKFCSSCVVYDQIPKQRTNLKWILNRRFLSSCAFTIRSIRKKQTPTYFLRISIILRSIFILIVGFPISIFLTFLRFIFPLYTDKFFKKILFPNHFHFFNQATSGHKGLLNILAHQMGKFWGVFNLKTKSHYANPTIEKKK